MGDLSSFKRDNGDFQSHKQSNINGTLYINLAMKLPLPWFSIKILSRFLNWNSCEEQTPEAGDVPGIASNPRKRHTHSCRLIRASRLHDLNPLDELWRKLRRFCSYSYKSLDEGRQPTVNFTVWSPSAWIYSLCRININWYILYRININWYIYQYLVYNIIRYIKVISI